MPKGVAYLQRYAAVSATANHRYLDALAVVDRASRAFNPAAPTDLSLFTASSAASTSSRAVALAISASGSFAPPAARDPRRSGQGSRLVKRLHLRGLVAKVPRSRRWRVTALGHAVMSAAVPMREGALPERLLTDAA